MKSRVAGIACALGAALLSAMACSTPSDPRFVETAPDRASFVAVSDLLEHRCGSLDCHGMPERNLRLYGSDGLRLDPSSRPSSIPSTTPAEYDQDYLSVIGLEPAIMSDVVSESGASPDRLTMIRKARGTEDHKGGQIWQAGDPSDQCLTSWLAGNTATATCVSATADTP